MLSKTLSFSRPVKRSLIYILNKKGDKIPSCLSSFSDKNDSNIRPFQRIHRDNSEYNKNKTLTICTGNWRNAGLLNNLTRLTRSNAFCMSSVQVNTSEPLLR